MTCGLRSLVDNLDEFPVLSKYFEGRQLELLRRKGVYPYEYMDRLSKLAEKNYLLLIYSILISPKKVYRKTITSTRKLYGKSLR